MKKKNVRKKKTESIVRRNDCKIEKWKIRDMERR